MPYLNWKEQKRLLQQIGPALATSPDAGSAHPHDERGAKLRMTLTLESTALRELLPLLRETLLEAQPGAEFRLDLPRGWIVFWKKRDGESRLLVAHPQVDEWVATVALSEGHALLAVERLEALSVGDSLNLGDLAPTGNISNLEFTLAHQPATHPGA